MGPTYVATVFDQLDRDVVIVHTGCLWVDARIVAVVAALDSIPVDACAFTAAVQKGEGAKTAMTVSPIHCEPNSNIC